MEELQQPRTREELYEILQTKTREEFVVEQMVRLGYWPAAGTLPHDPADEIRRRGELQRELDELRKQTGRLYDEAAFIKELRKRRLTESRQKRKENKERKLRERAERATAWAAQQEKEITYLGTDVSAGLQKVESDAERLSQHNLPHYDTPIDLAAAMGLTVNQLRFLAFARRTGTVSHYVHFTLPKKSGGTRSIHAPKKRLKAAQHWILANILNYVALDPSAHGFRPARSIVSNAKPHVGADIVINFDLENFFPTITYPRIKGVFQALGYGEAVATVLALVCTAPDFDEVTLDGQTYFIATGERYLPQGAPTSPALTNILCRRLDKRLAALAESAGDVLYTRYADDLTFSVRGAAAEKLPKFFREVRNIVTHEGLVVNEKKTRILRRGRQQEVTGIVVNDKLSLDRETLHRFRAVLYQIEKEGPEGKRWGQAKDLFSALLGYANFVQMVDAEKGAKFKAKVQMLREKYRPAVAEIAPEMVAPTPETVVINEVTAETEAPSAPPKPEKKWWKLW